MTRIIAAALVCAMLACGGDGPEPSEYADEDFDRAEETGEDRADTADDDGNEPPMIDAVRLVPTEPRSGDTLTVTLKIFDPENDRVDLEVDWFVNGDLAKSGPDTTFDTDELRRGDQVYAEVYVSDGLEETYGETAIVQLGNQAPTVRSARIVPARPTAGDTLLVEAEAVDPDGDTFEYRYQWYVDERELSGESGASLPPGTVERGSSVQVAVTATDGSGESSVFRSPPVEIANSVPEFTSEPAQASVSGGRYTYQLAAEDPDGDKPLRFSLVSGPPGLDVDLVSGLVSWDVPNGEGGKFPVVVSVTDAYGGRDEQSYTVELTWAAEPASADGSGDEDASETP